MKANHYLLIKLDQAEIEKLGDYEISFNICRKENVAEKDIGFRDLYLHEIICLNTGKKNQKFLIYKKNKNQQDIQGTLRIVTQLVKQIQFDPNIELIEN